MSLNKGGEMEPGGGIFTGSTICTAKKKNT